MGPADPMRRFSASKRGSAIRRFQSCELSSRCCRCGGALLRVAVGLHVRRATYSYYVSLPTQSPPPARRPLRDVRCLHLRRCRQNARALPSPYLSQRVIPSLLSLPRPNRQPSRTAKSVGSGHRRARPATNSRPPLHRERPLPQPPMAAPTFNPALRSWLKTTSCAACRC